jgi:hypothetical protein
LSIGFDGLRRFTRGLTGLSSLENKRTAPKRKPGYSRELVRAVRAVREADLFFRPDTKRHKKRSKAAKTAHERKRKPSNLKADGARQIIEFDMKHVLGGKYYAFCAIDPCTKEAVILKKKNIFL